MSRVRKAISQMRYTPTDIPDLALWVLPPPKGLYNPLSGGWSIAPLNGSSVGYRMDMSKKCSLGPNIAPPTISGWNVDSGAARIDTGEFIDGYPIYEVYSKENAVFTAPIALVILPGLEGKCLYQVRVLAKAASSNEFSLYFANTVGQGIPVTVTEEWCWYSGVRLTVSNQYVDLRTTGSGGPSSSIYVAAIEIRKIEGNHLVAVDGATRPVTADSPPSIVYDTVNDNWSTNFTDPVAGTMLVATKHGILHTEVDIPAGPWNLFVDPAYNNVATDFEIVIYNRVLSPTELDIVKGYLTKPEYMTSTDFSSAVLRTAWFRGNTYLRKVYLSGISFTNVTNLNQFVRLSGCQEIVFDGPIDDSLVSSYGSFAANANLQSFDATKLTIQSALTVSYMFQNNGGLTYLDLSTWTPRPDLSSFYRFARGCSSLETVITTPALFDTDCVNYEESFYGCALDQPSVDGIINNLHPAVITRNLKAGLLGIDGGTSATPSYLAKANIDIMGIMDWVCNSNGHTNKTSPLLLDFTDKLTALRGEWITQGWVYTRTGPKWVLQDGVFVELAENQFGTTWDQYEGLYCYTAEKASTNVFTWSEGDLTTLDAYTAITLSTGILGLDNSFYFGDNAVSRSLTKTYTGFTTGNSYTASFFVQKDDNAIPMVGNSPGNDFYINFAGLVNVIPSFIEEVYPNFYRVVVTTASAVTGSGSLEVIKPVDASATGFKLTGLMLEDSAYVSSYIKTVATAVTRQPDVLKLNLTGLANLDTADLSLHTDATTKYQTGEPRFLLDLNGTSATDDRIYIAYNVVNNYAIISSSGGVNNDPFNYPNHPTSRARVMVASAPTRTSVSFMGNSVLEDATSTPPVDAINLSIGCNGVNDGGQPRANIYKAGLILKTASDLELTTLSTYSTGDLFTPNSLSDIQLWMSASNMGAVYADNQQVETWIDSSINNRSYTQSNLSLRPWFRTNVINGKPIIRFDGNDYLERSLDNPFPTGNGEYTVFVVFAPSADVVSTIFFAGTGVDNQAFLLRNQPTLALNDGWWANNMSSPNNTLSLGGFVIARVQYNAITGRTMYINSTLVASNASTTKNTAAGTSYIGSQLAGGSPFQGDIAELLIFSRELTEIESGMIEAYLDNQYNIL